MDVVPVLLLGGLLPLERFEARLGALQGCQRGAGLRRGRLASVRFTADHLSHGLNHAEGVVFRENAFFDQVMNQAVEQQIANAPKRLRMSLLIGIFIIIGAHVLGLQMQAGARHSQPLTPEKAVSAIVQIWGADA